jgi:mannitol-1-phosphate/altronate dehydrogenase
MNAWPIRILHLGLGRFHRAHQAVYYQNLFEQFGEKWGVVSFSMRSSDARDELRRAHNHYPVVQFSKDESLLQWIDVIRASYFMKEDHDQFLKAMASPDLAMVTLTVTEKAYVGTDLYELLYEGLRHRQAIDRPLTVLSCDNLQENGSKVKTGVLKVARESGDASMAAWIEKSVTFPNSMVDRIVPALTPERVTVLQAQFKTDNQEILATEIFSQWVIEDRFAAARPPLEKVGVQIVSDVRPFEEVKLRLLNASHSLIAYAGLLKNYRFVHEAIHDPEIRGRRSASC